MEGAYSMADPYMIRINLVPSPENKNPQLHNIGGAEGFVIVFDSSKSGALDKATRYVQGLGWSVVQVTSELLLLPEHLPLLDAKTTKLYQDAELLGICGHFDAWPKKPRPGEYSVQSLKKPPEK